MNGWKAEEMRYWQRSDSEIRPLVQSKESREMPCWNNFSLSGSMPRKYLGELSNLTLVDGVLTRVYANQHGEKKMQTVLPAAKRNEAWLIAHEVSLRRHRGRKKTLEKLRERFWWVGIREDVKRWCQQCETCTMTKPRPSYELTNSGKRGIRDKKPPSSKRESVKETVNRTAKELDRRDGDGRSQTVKIGCNGSCRNKDYAPEPRQKLSTIHSEARDTSLLEGNRMRSRDELRVNGQTFDEGEQVWLYSPTRKKKTACSRI